MNQIKTVFVTIEGLSPYLMHRFAVDAEVSAETRTVKHQNLTPAEEAEQVVNRDEAGTLYFPGAAISRLLREAGRNHKQRGSRRSLMYIVPAAVIVLDEIVAFHDQAGTLINDYEIDSRPVVIPATKGRIMRHRPRLEKWQGSFTVEVDEAVLDTATIHQLLEEGGRRIGIGDYRPDKGGPYGRFAIIKWEVS